MRQFPEQVAKGFFCKCMKLKRDGIITMDTDCQLFQGKVHRFSARRRTPGRLYNLHHIDVEIPADNAFNCFVVADAIYEVANWFGARLPASPTPKASSQFR